MSASVIRSRAMVTHAIDRYRWNEISDGAVLQEDGVIRRQATATMPPKVTYSLSAAGKELVRVRAANGRRHGCRFCRSGPYPRGQARASMNLGHGEADS